MMIELVADESDVMGNDKPVRMYCGPTTTIAKIKERIAELCADRPGCLGSVDINVTFDGGKLFNMMPVEEAGIVHGSQLVWTCKDRSGAARERANGNKPMSKAERQALKERAEEEFGSIKDPCEWKKGGNARAYTAGADNDDDEEEEVLVSKRKRKGKNNDEDGIFNEHDEEAY